MTALDFSRRSCSVELMDDASVDYVTFKGCLIDLAKANWWTLAHRPTLAFLRKLNDKGRWPNDQALHFLDVGSGYGDLLRTVGRWGRRKGLLVRLTGLDLNPWSARAASSVTSPDCQITWMTGDAFDFGCDVDVISCSLFTHHLSDRQIVEYLKLVEEKARVGWFINDLHRHPLPYFGFSILSTAMNWHRFVRHDGPVSVARAFKKRDWERYIAEAGLGAGEVSVSWRFPFRLCVSRVKDAR